MFTDTDDQGKYFKDPQIQKEVPISNYYSSMLKYINGPIITDLKIKQR